MIDHAKLRRVVAELERAADHPDATPEQQKEATRLTRNGRRTLAK